MAQEVAAVVCAAALCSGALRGGHVVEAAVGGGCVVMAFPGPRVGLDWALATQLQLMTHDW